MNRKNLLSIIVLIAILAIAYGIYTNGMPEGQLRQQIEENQTNREQEDKNLAPDFSLNDINGATVKLSDYKGKLVVLNFWTTWCKYCRLEMPDFIELNRELSQGSDAAILTINVEEGNNTVQSYLTKNNINLTVLLDTDGTTARAYGVNGFPATFIIDKNGAVVKVITGATNKETILGIINKIK